MRDYRDAGKLETTETAETAETAEAGVGRV